MTVSQISASEAFAILKDDADSLLVDVRTFEETHFVGFVNASTFNNRMVFLPWQTFPNMELNQDFETKFEQSLKELFAEKAKQTKIFFLCRTGSRSYQAACFASDLDYENCYNITSGFEGDFNNDGQRGSVNGWKASRLPWRQK